MEGKTDERSDRDLEKLRVAQSLREYHHHALWEEEKHFIWLNSIVLAAQATILIKPAKELPSKDILLVALSVVGFVLAVIALRVIRREGGYFSNALKLYVTQHNIVFSKSHIPDPSAVPNRRVHQLFYALFSRDLTIRDAFQLTMLVFASVDVLLAASVLMGWV